MKSEQELMYTSVGNKFWHHRKQMESYRNGDGKTVISTHISPEGVCNLRCPYCSVTYRKVSNRINMEVIQNYVEQLIARGLKAVILTGGGEPTIYPQFNELVRWLSDQGLKIALITNGTQAKRVDETTWGRFTWVRVSINLFDGWEDKIQIPYEFLRAQCVVGSSFVFTQKHENPEQIDIDLLKRVAVVARKNNARYVRLLPNCLLPQASLLKSHDALASLLAVTGDNIFFHQHKVHGAPKCSKCHQSYFRPYLSEVPYQGTGIPGSVYPCDSVVLNNEYAQFMEQYQLCAPADIGKYLDGQIEQKFDARSACTGCVFTDNVNMLDDWKNNGTGDIKDSYIDHQEFV